MNQPSEPQKTIFFGFGSPHGFDQIGWHIIDAIDRLLPSSTTQIPTELYKLKTPIDLLNHALASNPDQPTSRTTLWILIDACININTCDNIAEFKPNPFNQTPRIHRWDWPPKNDSPYTLANPTPIGSSHGVGLIETLQLAETLGLTPDSVCIFAIECNLPIPPTANVPTDLAVDAKSVSYCAAQILSQLPHITLK
jgi:hypothetical protein